MGYIVFLFAWVFICLLLSASFGEAGVFIFFALFFGVPIVGIFLLINSDNNSTYVPQKKRNDSNSYVPLPMKENGSLTNYSSAESKNSKVSGVYQNCSSIDDIIELYIERTSIDEMYNYEKLGEIRDYIIFERRFFKNDVVSVSLSDMIREKIEKRIKTDSLRAKNTLEIDLEDFEKYGTDIVASTAGRICVKMDETEVVNKSINEYELKIPNDIWDDIENKREEKDTLDHFSVVEDRHDDGNKKQLSNINSSNTLLLDEEKTKEIKQIISKKLIDILILIKESKEADRACRKSQAQKELAFESKPIDDFKKYRFIEKIEADEIESENDLGLAEFEIFDNRESFVKAIIIPVDTNCKKKNDDVYEKMRRIAQKYNDGSLKDLNRVFYEQAKFMENHSESMSYMIDFESYFHNYQDMQLSQLKSYFYWRSAIRNNNFQKTSLSYIYIYADELINKIGVKDSNDGLNKLINLWKFYRGEYRNLDKYLPEWIRDYNIIHNCNRDYVEVVMDLYSEFEKSGTPSRWLSCEVVIAEYLNKTYNIPQQVLAKISGYKFLKSTFFKGKHGYLVLEIVPQVFSEIEKLKVENGEDTLVDLLIREKNEQQWKPFRSASFYADAFIQNQEFLISDSIKIWCENGNWYSTYPQHNLLILSNHIGEIIKATESAIREEFDCRGKLRIEKINESVINISKKVVVNYLKKVKPIAYSNELDRNDKSNNSDEIIFDPNKLSELRKKFLMVQEELLKENDSKSIEQNVNLTVDKSDMTSIHEKIAKNTNVSGKIEKSEIRFDQSLFDKIRKDSINIQEKLVLESDKIPLLKTLDPKLASHEMFMGKTVKMPLENKGVNGKWAKFYESLSEVDLKTLKVMIDSVDVNRKLDEIAKKQCVLLEVLLESINETALEHLGDNVLDTCDSPPSIYEDYSLEVNNLFLEVQ